MEADTIQKRYRIDRREISFLKFLLESYEGIAVPRTINDHIALVEVMIAPGFYHTFQELLQAVSEEMGMTPVLTSRIKGEPHDRKTDHQPSA